MSRYILYFAVVFIHAGIIVLVYKRSTKWCFCSIAELMDISKKPDNKDGIVARSIWIHLLLFGLFASLFIHVFTVKYLTDFDAFRNNGEPYMQRNDALMLILRANEFLYMYLMLVAMFLNLFLCDDLVRLLTSPFIVAKTRLMMYYTIAFTVPFILVIIIMKMPV